MSLSCFLGHSQQVNQTLFLSIELGWANVDIVLLVTVFWLGRELLSALVGSGARAGAKCVRGVAGTGSRSVVGWSWFALLCISTVDFVSFFICCCLGGLAFPFWGFGFLSRLLDLDWCLLVGLAT